MRPQFRGDLLVEVLGRATEVGGLAPDSPNGAEMRFPSDPEDLEEFAPSRATLVDELVEGVTEVKRAGKRSPSFELVADESRRDLDFGIAREDGEDGVGVVIEPRRHLLEDQGQALVNRHADGLGLFAKPLRPCEKQIDHELVHLLLPFGLRTVEKNRFCYPSVSNPIIAKIDLFVKRWW